MTKAIVYVDLDGTLSPSDILLECCLQLLKKNILFGFLMIWWAFKGPWVLKTEVAMRIDPVLDHLPINPLVLERLNQLKSAGHELVLASASVHRDVQKVAKRLGIFNPTEPALVTSSLESFKLDLTNLLTGSLDL